MPIHIPRRRAGIASDHQGRIKLNIQAESASRIAKIMIVLLLYVVVYGYSSVRI